MATVVPFPNFNADTDAEALRKAMKGFGTDEKAIIAIIANRTAHQRMAIVQAYKLKFGRDIVEDFKAELTGNFEDVICACMHERADYEAICLRKAMAGAGTNEHVIVEIILTRNAAEISAIKTAYAKLFKKDLENDIKSEVGGHLKKILVIALQCGRPTTAADLSKAKQDAEALWAAGEKCWGTTLFYI